jgi:outer membrane protein assembly factor BamA
MAHGVAAEAGAVIEPVEDAELGLILGNSFTLPLLLNLEDQTGVDLTTEVAAEVQKLTGIMYARGYLEARVEVTGEGTQADPFRFLPVPGQLYRIGWIRIDALPEAAPEKLQLELGYFTNTKIAAIVRQEVLREIEKGVLFQLHEASYGNAVVEETEITIDPETKTAGVVVTVQPGAPLTFGRVSFSGSYHSDDSSLQDLVSFATGDPYSETKLNALQGALTDTNLFRRIRIDMVEAPDNDGQMDINVELRDSTPDPDVLDATSGKGPRRLIVTMFMIVLVECLRVTSYWGDVTFRRAMLVPVILMIGFSVLMIGDRLYDFLR